MCQLLIIQSTTLAYNVGADAKMVSEILGHSSTSVTMDVYTHLIDEKKKQQEEIVKTIKVLWFCDNLVTNLEQNTGKR